MIVKDFLQYYHSDGIVQTISEEIRLAKAGDSIYIKGLCGSMDTVLISSLSKEKQPFLIICEEKEEAHYVINDLQALLGDSAVLLFPMSHKKPYEWEEVDNANVLMRAEVLNLLSNYQNAYTLYQQEVMKDKQTFESQRQDAIKHFAGLRILVDTRFQSVVNTFLRQLES